MRNTVIATREDWFVLLDQMNDGDVQHQLHAEFVQWAYNETCEQIEFTVDSLGRIDSESSPRPAG